MQVLSFCLSFSPLFCSQREVAQIEDLGRAMSVDLHGRKIESISNLNGLTNLRCLDLSFNHITDMRGWVAAADLRFLRFGCVSPLERLNLWMRAAAGFCFCYGLLFALRCLKECPAYWQGLQRARCPCAALGLCYDTTPLCFAAEGRR